MLDTPATKQTDLQSETTAVTAALAEKVKNLEDAKRAIFNILEDLKEAKAVIEIEKAKDEAILDSIGDGIVTVDQNAKVLFINQAAEKLLGFSSQEIVGRPWFEMEQIENKRGEKIVREKRPLQLALSHGKTITTTTTTTTTYYFTRKDKTRFPAGITVTPIILSGKIIGAVQVIRDMSKEVQIDKAKTEFISLASHQLRTPLGLVKWSLEALGGQPDFKSLPEATKTSLNEIYRSNERVINLVRNLLSISRIDQGKVKDNPSLTDVTALVKEVVKEMAVMAAKKKIKLDLVVKSAKLPPVMIDSLRLHEVVENLLANAIQYNKPSGVVTVAVDRNSDDSFAISVADTGIGISQKDQAQLFSKFFRSEKSAANNVEGSGLGLYLIKSYTEAWGGKVSVASTEGQGSTFTIALPLKPKIT